MYIMYITWHIAWYIPFVLMSLLVSPNDSQPDTGRLNASVSQAVTLHISYWILHIHEILGPVGNTLSWKDWSCGFEPQYVQMGFESFV